MSTVLDTNVVNTYFGGRDSPKGVSLFVKSVEILLSKIESRFDAFAIALSENDRSQIHFLAHQMKGSFLLVGANRLGTLFREIENGAKALPLETLQKSFAEAVKQRSLFEKEISKFLQQLQAH